MTTSAKGIALIEQFEGLRLKAYQDLNGIWTIGYGHAQARKDQYETQAQAQADLCTDLASAEHAVNTSVHVRLNQNQFDALASFTYNEGTLRLQNSTMLRMINANYFESAAYEFPRWDIVDGKACPGLLSRRLAEQQLFMEAAA